LNATWPKHLGRVILDQTDSTNSEAARMAKTGAASAWILAKTQTNGKGSRGRNWETGDGNFSASLLLHLNETPQNAALRSFSAALALADTLESLGVDAKSISLKWPNDVLVDGRKIAGILLESSGRGQSIDQLIVGIGINLISAPPLHKLAPNAVRPISLLAATQKTVKPEQVLDHLASAFEAHETQLATHGFDPIRRQWLQRAARFGQNVTILQGDKTLSGTFSDIDTTGALVLTADTGSHLISAGEIFFPTAT